MSDATGRQPIGQSEGGKQRSAALADAPSKIASGLRSGVLGNLMPQAEGYAPYRPRPPAEIKKENRRSDIRSLHYYLLHGT